FREERRQDSFVRAFYRAAAHLGGHYRRSGTNVVHDIRDLQHGRQHHLGDRIWIAWVLLWAQSSVAGDVHLSRQLRPADCARSWNCWILDLEAATSLRVN